MVADFCYVGGALRFRNWSAQNQVTSCTNASCGYSLLHQPMGTGRSF